jgi:hypothetical protein
MTPVDVDANRILIKRDNGHLVVLRGDGSIVRDLPFRPGQVRSAKLDGSSIVIQTRKSLVNYDASSGRAERSWSTTGLEDVEGGVAVSRHSDGIHLLRLADRHRATIPLRSVVAARLTRAGLFYATRSPGKNQLGYVPSSALLARIR